MPIISIKEIEFLIKNLPAKKVLVTDGFMVNFSK